MTGQRRRLGKERHTMLKVAVSLASVGGFGIAWAALHAAHDPGPAGSAAAQAVTPGSQPAQGSTPEASATRRPRMSRGS